MEPIIDHIDITVENLERAEEFYDRLLPLLGFDLSKKEYTEVPEHEYKLVEYHNKNMSIGFVNRREAFKGEKVSRRKAGALHHLAFRTDSRREVDELFLKIKALPAVILHPPKIYPEYCADYYAFFFKDSEGIELEIVYFDRKKYFPEK